MTGRKLIASGFLVVALMLCGLASTRPVYAQSPPAADVEPSNDGSK
jgi:hypothetical protein